MGKGIGGIETPIRGATNTWITPQHIPQSLGRFDLDPCEADEQPWRHATRGYKLRHDGLRRPWNGRVWLNPPYGPEAGAWLEKLAEHGNGIALIFARCETKWFRRAVWERADGLLYLDGRLTFCDETGKPGSSNSGAPSVLIAYGSSNVQSLESSGLAGFLVTGWRRVE